MTGNCRSLAMAINFGRSQARRGACRLAAIVVAANLWLAFANPLYGKAAKVPHRCCLRASGSDLPDKWKAGPADVYTGVAQKALYLMKENPMLFDMTVDEELEKLQEEKYEEEKKKKVMESPAKDDQLVLRRRIEEVKMNERIRAVTELLYLKVCRKFQQLQVPLIPALKEGGDVKFGNVDLKGLTTDIYSQDALELVREHLFRIIGQQGNPTFAGGLGVVQIALFQAGQVYAMSAMFGYYLRRVDQRYQLEKLAGNFGAWGEEAPETTSNPFTEDQGAADSLKAYITSFGPDEVQSMWSVTSVEAQMAMESQVTALFGDLRALKEKLVNVLGMVNSPEEATMKLEQAIKTKEVESLKLTSDDLRRLVLEAVAYGSLLNDSEKQFDSVYELTPASSRIMGVLTGDDDEGRMLPE
ncbi:unnamed protein product [Effrenium voratum]|uniref:Uncharacterized protein n=1 Tax=Effrenium voratum TaxID=2562239 RepID=A0AA36N186_9DINO|nr:unnamed protein product [Effrenium voratum]CAJ1437686.1 unnamed protein product [Effrenium voratum]